VSARLVDIGANLTNTAFRETPDELAGHTTEAARALFGIAPR
jgi:hypothetical protein